MKRGTPTKAAGYRIGFLPCAPAPIIRAVTMLVALGLAGGCEQSESGPIVVSAIGAPPELRNPNLSPLDPPSAILIQLAAQGLVRFDAAGQIEPALAQSWIVSNDGLRYTFRLARTNWSNGRPVTAKQVVERIRATMSAASKNPLKPLLGSIADVEAMTENVLEISLKAPQPNFLQLLAHPEMGLLWRDRTTGPYVAKKRANGAVLLQVPVQDEELADDTAKAPDIILRGEPAAMAVARFRSGGAALVTGGTAGDLPIARVAELRADTLRFDPVSGLFGLVFTHHRGPLGEPAMRQALAMAIDRAAIAETIGIPGLQARETLVAAGLEDLASPALPEWVSLPFPARRARAAAIVQGQAEALPLKLRVAVPEGPGYRIVFAHLRRDWRAIGVEAEAVKLGRPADLKLLDKVAPAFGAPWYLRHFTCSASAICSTEADALLEQARIAQNPLERQGLLARADLALTSVTPFIPLTSPVRWSLVAPRLTGYRSNPFNIRFLGGLVEAGR